jgi:hypothetical protein
MKSGASRHSESRGQSDNASDPGLEIQAADGSEAGAADARPELADATRYDLDRLERAIRGLVAQQQVLKRENERLRAAVTERDALVARLEGDLESAEGRRKFAISRVEALIDEMDRLDAALDRSMADANRMGADPSVPAVERDEMPR